LYANTWLDTGLTYQFTELSAHCPFDEAIRLDPMHKQSWFAKGLTYLDIALSSDKEIYYTNTIQCFNKVIEIDPLDQDAWINKGVALSRMDDNEVAINSMNKALEINPKNYYAWFDLSFCFIGLGRFEEALYPVNKALELYNINSSYWHNKYNSFTKEKNYIDADNACNNAFILNVEMSWVLTLKGDILSRLALWNQESFIDALIAYEEAIIKFKFNILARSGKCIALYALGHIYYSRKAYLDAVPFAHLLNQNTPYIDAFETPRYWR